MILITTTIFFRYNSYPHGETHANKPHTNVHPYKHKHRSSNKNNHSTRQENIPSRHNTNARKHPCTNTYNYLHRKAIYRHKQRSAHIHPHAHKAPHARTPLYDPLPILICCTSISSYAECDNDTPLFSLIEWFALFTRASDLFPGGVMQFKQCCILFLQRGNTRGSFWGTARRVMEFQCIFFPLWGRGGRWEWGGGKRRKKTKKRKRRRKRSKVRMGRRKKGKKTKKRKRRKRKRRKTRRRMSTATTKQKKKEEKEEKIMGWRGDDAWNSF